jgi:hypothetical protein
MRHLTRIVGVPIGVNLLGLLELFAFIGVLFGMIALTNYVHAVILLALLVGSVIGIIVFDLWWRRGQPEVTWWGRLFSPFAGGCFFYVPIWLLFPGGIVGCIIAVLLNRK